MTVSTTLDTPDGPFTIVADDGVVLASGWTDDVASLLALVHPDLRPVLPVPAVPTSDPDVSRPAAAVRAYYAGDPTAVGQVPVRQRSGPYRQHAWEVLRTVPAGDRVTYTEYADKTGRPAAVRAAAGACARNAAALFVPCHRVLRSDGTLGGFRYGLPIKESLLARERAAA
ncbi:methylated-DNA--[protein]-cysteine S-methyltransferase [Isoptericola croceus]|uniref:methylated-DNA--[protein]-cysteine S-methyltransferase n=1 Tax=Isoptericola croceus TaxID=3031406 RepID=UPI0023F65D8A|nr:methylated-DNA--[protein]-cysteine S-methyltransferase [Isoptericola croceus]